MECLSKGFNLTVGRRIGRINFGKVCLSNQVMEVPPNLPERIIRK